MSLKLREVCCNTIWLYLLSCVGSEKNQWITSQRFDQYAQEWFWRPQPKAVSDVITKTVTEFITRLSFSLNSRINDQQPKQFLVGVAKTHSRLSSESFLDVPLCNECIFLCLHSPIGYRASHPGRYQTRMQYRHQRSQSCTAKKRGKSSTFRHRFEI